MKFMSALAIVALLVCAGLAPAATINWSMGTSGGDWAVGTNWTGGNVPGAADTAYFPITGQIWTNNVVNINAPTSVGAVTVSTYPNEREYVFMGTGSLSVVGDFYWANDWATNFQPTLTVGGVFRTAPTTGDARFNITFGSGSHSGYTTGDVFTGGIYNYNDTTLDFGGGGTFGGMLLTQGYTNPLDESKNNAGVIKLGGTKTFNPGTTFSLGTGGILQVTNNTDFSNIASVTFTGGMLKLDNTANIFPNYGTNGLVVAQGAVSITANNCLGADDTNALTLGGNGTVGTLMGAAIVNSMLTRQLNLAGNGGMIYNSANYNGANPALGQNPILSIGGLIAGSGTLFKNGDQTVTIANNGGGVFNTYTGGTVVAGGRLSVDTNRTLGTGSVTVAPGGTLGISAGTNVASTASVLLQGGPLGGGTLDITANMAYPNIDPNSNGVISLNSISDNNTLTTVGTSFIGSSMGGASYSGATFPVGTDGVYRIGMTMQYFGQSNAWQSMLHVNAPLTGAHDLLLAYGGAWLTNAGNNFTGTTNVVHNVQWNGWTLDQLQLVYSAAGSVFGDAAGAVNLSNGDLYYANGAGNGLNISKGQLSISGRNIITVDGGTGHLSTSATFDSIVRQNNGILEVEGAQGVLGVPNASWGGDGTRAERLFVTNYSGLLNNNMIAPYIVQSGIYGGVDTSNSNFVTYGTTTGLVAVTYTQTSLPSDGLTGGTDIVQAPATALTADHDIYALRVDGNISGSNTVTVRSGGLIFSSGSTFSANLKAGDGTGELIVYSNASPTISGAITAGSVTKGGMGNLTLSGNNTGTLASGAKIYVEGGNLVYTADAALGGATIVLNGGGIQNATSYLIDTPVAIGPTGGYLYTYGGNYSGGISDLDPAHPGVLDVSSYTYYETPNTFSGTTLLNANLRLDYTGSPGTGSMIINSGCVLTDYGTGWTLNGRVTLKGGNVWGGCNMVFSNEHSIPGGQTWSFGSLDGGGSIIWGQPTYNGIGTPHLVVGSDGTNADYYGTITENGYGTIATVTKTGSGIWTLWGDSTWHGVTTINGGTMRINGGLYTGTEAAGAVTVNSGGTLDGKGTVERAVNVYSGGNLNGSLTVTGAVTSYGGTINMTGATINGAVALGVNGYSNAAGTFANSTINGPVTVGVAKAASTVTGTFTATNTTINSTGAIAINNGSFTGTNVAATATSNLTIGTVTANHVGTLSGTGNTFTLTNSGYTNLVNGSITGSNTFTSSGPYGFYVNTNGGLPCSLSGSNTINTASNAILGMGKAGDPAANTIVSGSNTINSCLYMYSGTLKGSNTINGNTLGALVTQPASNAIIAPSEDALSAGILTVVGDVTLDHSTTLNFNLASPGTAGSGINDLITITGNLTLDGTLNVNNLSGFGAGTYRLFNYTGTLTGAGLAQGTMPTGLGFTYTIDTSAANQVNLDVVTPWIEGDTDHSGGSTLNSLDIDAIYHHFGQAYTTQWKVAQDTNPVGQEDVTYELTQLMHTNYGDANLDRFTDFTDFQVLLDHWQATGGWAQGDFNGDGTVDFLDFQVLLDYWNPGGWNAGTSQVPEPASLSLILLGGLALLRRKK